MKVSVEVMPGDRLDEVATVAQSLADACGEQVEFVFNSIGCSAVPGGNARLLAERQQAAQRAVLKVSSQEGTALWMTIPEEDGR